MVFGIGGGGGLDFGFAEDLIGGITGQTGAEAAEKAGALQSQAIIESARINAAAQERGLNAMLEQLGLTRESFAPFLGAGVGALPELQEGFRPTRGATAGGLEANLAEIMGGEAFGSLLEERRRGVEGQLAAGGLTRSGTAIEEAARLPTDLAFDIENLLFGRQQGQEIARIQGLQNLVGTGLSAAGTSGGQAGNLTTQIVNQLSGIGQAEGAGVTGSAQAIASGVLGGAQAQQQGIQNIMNLGATLAAFSDPRLKENITVIGQAGPLDLVEWDWRPEFKDTIVASCPTIGFLSTQVKEFYPDLVGEFGGYEIINYPALQEELKCH